MSDFRMETRKGVLLTFGDLPITKMAGVVEMAPKGAVLAPGIASALGASLAAGLPEDVEALEKEIMAELKEAPPHIPGLPPKLAAWLMGPDTGLSSLAMLSKLEGIKTRDPEAWPRDAGDFGRCLGLLAVAPEYRDRMSEIATISPEWSAIVDRWSELEALYQSGDPEKWKDIYAILCSARQFRA